MAKPNLEAISHSSWQWRLPPGKVWYLGCDFLSLQHPVSSLSSCFPPCFHPWSDSHKRELLVSRMIVTSRDLVNTARGTCSRRSALQPATPRQMRVKAPTCMCLSGPRVGREVCTGLCNLFLHMLCRREPKEVGWDRM